MKLATLKDRTRDGMLVVVSRDLTRCVSARPIAATLQAALDDWEHVAPRLMDLAHGLDVGALPADRFHEHDALSPLPRAYQWAAGGAYPHHIALVRQARKAEVPAHLLTDPQIAQGGSDSFLAPRAPIVVPTEAFGIDLEAEVAVVTGDVPLGATRAEALAAIRLVMLVNDVSLRNLIPVELAKGCGLYQSKPAPAFSPVAVTPDELDDAWQDGRVHLPLHVNVNGKPLGRIEAGVDMVFDFAALIVHAAKTRPLGAGTIIGSGPVSNRGADGGPGRPVADGGAGYPCLAELRSAEQIATGAPKTPFLSFGDTVRIAMKGRNGLTVFGAIEQTVERPAVPVAVTDTETAGA